MFERCSKDVRMVRGLAKTLAKNWKIFESEGVFCRHNKGIELRVYNRSAFGEWTVCTTHRLPSGPFYRWSTLRLFKVWSSDSELRNHTIERRFGTSTGFYWVLLNFNRFHWVPPASTRFHLVLLDPTFAQKLPDKIPLWRLVLNLWPEG